MPKDNDPKSVENCAKAIIYMLNDIKGLIPTQKGKLGDGMSDIAGLMNKPIMTYLLNQGKGVNDLGYYETCNDHKDAHYMTVRSRGYS